MLTAQRISLNETSSISLRVGGVGFFLKHYLNQQAGLEGGEDWPLVGNVHFISQLEPCFEHTSRVLGLLLFL